MNGTVTMVNTNAGSMEHLMTTISDQMRSSDGLAGPTILHQGFLLKRGRGVSGRRTWIRRFFVLTSEGVLNYFSEKVLRRDPGTFRLMIHSKEV